MSEKLPDLPQVALKCPIMRRSQFVVYIIEYIEYIL